MRRICAEGVDHMQIRYAGAVSCGTDHRESGAPCADSVLVLERDGDVFAVLSDGAGSVEGSRRASEAAVHVTVHMLEKEQDALFCTPDEALKRILVREIRKGTEELAGMEADCTLLFAVLKKDGRYLAGHLGDGVILLYDEHGNGSLFSDAENGEKENSTYFVAGPETEKHLRLYRGKMNGTGGMILTSDGLARLLYYANTKKTAPAADIMMNWTGLLDEETVREKLQLEMDELFSRETRDDMSLIVLSWKNDTGTEQDGESNVDFER